MSIKLPRKCNCISCVTADQTNGKVHKDCLFLGGPEEDYHCILVDAKTRQEKSLRKKYFEFLSAEKGIDIKEQNVPIMLLETGVVDEFKDYLENQ